MSIEREFKNREKTTHKMTRNGLVERSTDGKERNISGRDADFDLRGDSVHEILERVSTERPGKRKQQLPPMETDTRQTVDNRQSENFNDEGGSSRSEALASFVETLDTPFIETSGLGHDRTSEKVSRLQDKADRTDTRLEKARENIPSKRKPKFERTFDRGSGKASKRLHFEETPLPPQGQRKQSLPKKAITTVGGGAFRVGSAQFHRKVNEVEHENVGVEAAHKTEIAAEGLMRGGKKVTQSAYRFARNAPYRKVTALEAEAAWARSKLQFQKAAAEQVEKSKGNAVSRYIQRQRLKRKYVDYVSRYGSLFYSFGRLY